MAWMPSAQIPVGPASLSIERVMNHWQEDLMFGYQFLNGCNPVLIKRCTKLPPKLPVTTEMVECSLERQLSLEQEVQVGPVFSFSWQQHLGGSWVLCSLRRN
jgi:hypothetical protein